MSRSRANRRPVLSCLAVGHTGKPHAGIDMEKQIVVVTSRHAPNRQKASNEHKT